MDKKWEHYERIHKIKFKLGIFGAILILGIFTTIYMSFVQVSIGYSDNGIYRNYEPYKRGINLDDDPNNEIILLSARRISVREENSITESGFNDFARVVVFDVDSEKELWDFEKNDTNFVLGYFGLTTEQDNETNTYAIVQFAQVENEETIVRMNNKDDEYYRVKNETGLYETYMVDLANNDSGKIIKYSNEMNVINRIVKIHYLKYDSNDNNPDFMVETHNDTLENTDESELCVTLHAFYANGTKAWVLNGSSPSSPLYGLLNFINNDGIMGSVLNSTNFAYASKDQKLINFNYVAQKVDYNISVPEYNLQYKSVLSSNFDFNDDEVNDIVVYYYNETNGKCHVGIFNSNNGAFINEIIPITVNEYGLADMRALSRFSKADKDLLIYNDDDSKLFEIFSISSTGFESIYSETFLEGNFGNQMELKNYYFGDLGEYLALPFQFQEQRDLVKLIDIEEGKIVEEDQWNLYGGFIYDIDVENSFIELINIEDGNDGLVIFGLGSQTRVFQVNIFQTIYYGINLVLIGLSLIVLLRNRKQLISLLMKETRITDLNDSEKSDVSNTFDDTNEPKSQIEIEDSEDSDIIVTEQDKEIFKSIEKIRKTAIIILIILAISAVFFFIFILIMDSGTNIYGSANVIAIRNVVISLTMMFMSLTFTTTLYNHFSPHSAVIYVKIQRWFYSKIRKNRNYQVVVLNMNYGKKFLPATIMKRSMFPIFVSLTLGLWVFSAFASDAATTQISGDVNIAFISDFEVYAVITFILSYMGMIFIIPGGWLLDDAGVVYYEEPKDFIHPGDISKISEWLINWMKGLFGVTAIINYWNLFKNFDFVGATKNDDIFMAIITIVFVLIILLVLSPILYGILTMFLSNTAMVGDLKYNQQVLYEKLEDLGINTKPRDLKAFFQGEDIQFNDKLKSTKTIETDRSFDFDD